MFDKNSFVVIITGDPPNLGRFIAANMVRNSLGRPLLYNEFIDDLSETRRQLLNYTAVAPISSFSISIIYEILLSKNVFLQAHKKCLTALRFLLTRRRRLLRAVAAVRL